MKSNHSKRTDTSKQAGVYTHGFRGFLSGRLLCYLHENDSKVLKGSEIRRRAL